MLLPAACSREVLSRRPGNQYPAGKPHELILPCCQKYSISEKPNEAENEKRQKTGPLDIFDDSWIQPSQRISSITAYRYRSSYGKLTAYGTR